MKPVEDNYIFKFLTRLNIEFDEVRGRIIGRQPLPLIGEVFSELRIEESRKNVLLGKKVIGVSIETWHWLLLMQMLARPLSINGGLVKDLECGVTTATKLTILRKPLGRFMTNQQIGKATNLVIHPIMCFF